MPNRERRHPVAIHMPPWGVAVAESDHAQNFQMRAMNHRYLKLLYLIRGCGVFGMAEQVLPCAAGDLIVVPIGQHHRLADRAGAPMALYVLGIQPDVLQDEAGLLDRLPTGVVPLSPREQWPLRASLRRLLYEQSAPLPGRAVMMTALAGQLLVDLARREPRESSDQGAGAARQRVALYVRQLEHRFFEAGTIDEAAAALGVSRRRFTQLFRLITGTSWQCRVRDLRLSHARRLLLETDRSVAAIAFECGFGDLSNFYRAFRAAESTSPHAWRQLEKGHAGK